MVIAIVEFECDLYLGESSMVWRGICKMSSQCHCDMSGHVSPAAVGPAGCSTAVAGLS